MRTEQSDRLEVGLVNLTDQEKAEITQIRVLREQPLPEDILARIRQAPEPSRTVESAAAQ
jgi:hypothetical protein